MNPREQVSLLTVRLVDPPQLKQLHIDDRLWAGRVFVMASLSPHEL